MNSLKLLPFCFLVSSFITACGSSDSPKLAPASRTPPGQSKAIGANGMCTDAVVTEADALQTMSVEMIKNVSTTFGDLGDETKIEEATKKQEAELAKFTKRVQTFRETYGNFTCSFYKNGSTMRLNPSALYRAVDDVAAKAAPKSNPIGKDGDCTPEFTADHNAMTKSISANLGSMGAALRGILSKQRTGESALEEIAEMKRVGREAVAAGRNFRTKHPGVFTCNLTDEKGVKKVVDSVQLDIEMERLRDNLSRM